MLIILVLTSSKLTISGLANFCCFWKALLALRNVVGKLKEQGAGEATATTYGGSLISFTVLASVSCDSCMVKQQLKDLVIGECGSFMLEYRVAHPFTLLFCLTQLHASREY